MSDLPTPAVYRSFVLRARPQELPGDEHFAIETNPVALPSAGQVLVRVLLAALSPWQNQRLKDFKNYTQPFEIGELIDCDVLAQVVLSRCDIPVGQLVTGRLGWREWAVADPSQLQLVDSRFADTDWLGPLSSPGLTAYCAMDLFARPMPGQTLVVTSAAGAVGSYAVQLGKLAGMRVVGIAGSDEKARLVERQLGAEVCVNHSDSGFADDLHAACPDGVHLFFDTVGGPVADRVFDNLAKYARVLVVGRTLSNNSATPADDPINMRQLWAREATIFGFSRYSHPRGWAFARERMMNLLSAGKIHSVHHVVDGFEQTPTALRDMLAGRHVGKTLVRYAHTDDRL